MELSSKLIPLHSLVLSDPEFLAKFPPHEIISVDHIGQWLIGPETLRRKDFAAIIDSEIRHQLTLKLSLGQRVVFNRNELTGDSERYLTTIARNQGAVIITVDDDDWQIVPAPPVELKQHLQAHWEGITVIGDVHGNLDAMERALTWARSRRHFVWFLGDIIDYGKQSLQTANLAHNEVVYGHAAISTANHEQKIARWLSRNSDAMRLSDGNRITTNALQKLSPPERDHWTGRFRALLAHAVFHQVIGNITLAHAAVHPSFWTTDFDASANEQFATYGESDYSNGRYRRTHNWINAIPAGQIVIVGHDIVSKYPLIATGELGGTAVFLDTGCGKGGHLSSADLRFSHDELHLECFNSY